MTKLKIPRAAMPVVKVLRRDVERPGELPCGETDLTGMAWVKHHPKVPPECGPVSCCPMGLHPKSGDPNPEWDDGDGDETCSVFPAPNIAVKAFARWWDNLKGARAAEAVEAVWPARKRTKRYTKRKKA